MIGTPCTLDNVKVTDNVITADNYTSVGIVVGIDTTNSNDVNVNIRNLTIARNRIEITASPTCTADIYLRIGNGCAALGGFDSVSDTILVHDNVLHSGFYITTNPVTAATQGQITNFSHRNNSMFGGSTVLRHLASGAKMLGNTFAIGAPMKLGEHNGVIYSQGNIYSTFTADSGNAEFTWRSIGDTYLGSAASTDRVVTLNANSGKAQIAYFDRCTIDSSTTAPFGIRSAIYTTGTGNPVVHVRNLTSSSIWGSGRYEAGTGSITDYTGGRWYSSSYDPPTLNPGVVDATQTMTAPGARVGDDVRVVFSQALQGLRLEAWIPAADTISYRFSNPGSSAVNLLPGTIRATYVSPLN
jgi:hypothetical protein